MQRHQRGTCEHHGKGHYDTLPETDSEEMDVNAVGVLEEQSREEDEQQNFTVDIGPLQDRFAELVGSLDSRGSDSHEGSEQEPTKNK